jgi:hypothetical protein
MGDFFTHQRPARRCHRFLGLSALRESLLIADLVHSGLDDIKPDAFELATVPILTHWSVAISPRLIGIDEGGAILVLPDGTRDRVTLGADGVEVVGHLRPALRVSWP